MNAQAIVDKILEDARAAAAATLREANARAARMTQESEDRIAARRADTLARAQRDAQAEAGRMERMAQLEERKKLLADKRRMMDAAFDRALAQLTAMPPQAAQAFYLRLIPQLAQGDETLMAGAAGDGWLDAGFVAQANAALVQAGKPGKLTASPQRRPGAGGMILTRQEAEVNATYQALVESERLSLEGQVAQALFPEG